MVNIGKGYLSYTLAGLAVIGAIAGALMGYIAWDAALTMIWAGLAVFGIRRAVSP